MQVADDLLLQPNQMGVPLQTSSAFEGGGINSTPIIGKLDLKIDNYKDQEAFLLAPIDGCDVILGMPWHFKTHPVLDYVKKTLAFEAKGRKYFVTADAGDWHFSLANHIAIKKEIKASVSAYLIFARERSMSRESQTSSS